MNIGILGTRGIPNYHGGFEQFAEYFSIFLADQGHKVSVYCSGNHPYQQAEFHGVELIHCYDPEDRVGTLGQFIYDFNCIRDARKRNFDVLLQLGYTSNSVWKNFLPKKPIIMTNMDGLEWKRSKYNKWVQKFLKHAERWAVKSSDYLIADSVGIQQYLQKTYQRESEFIAYGAEVFDQPDASILKEYDLMPEGYHMLIARMEPENNIEVILDGVAGSASKLPFLVVGKTDTNAFGKHLVEKFSGEERIRFLGGIYNLEHLNNLRHFSGLYFHGHSVGGTNPSLLEAMASNCLIAAHSNPFNRAILGDDAYYFEQSDQVKQLLDDFTSKSERQQFLIANREKIQQKYAWPIINHAYLDFMVRCYEGH